jgi:protein-tyrosine-phosphatase
MGNRIYILFVCFDNALFSQLAEAVVQHYFSDRIIAFSAGIKPAQKVDDRTRFLMEGLGYNNIGEHTTKGLNEVPDFNFDFVITLGVQEFIHQVDADRRLEWRLPETQLLSIEEVARILEMLQMKIQQLTLRQAA